MKTPTFRDHGRQTKKFSLVRMFMVVWTCIMALAVTYLYHFHRLMLAKVPKALPEDHELNLDIIEMKATSNKALFQNSFSVMVVNDPRAEAKRVREQQVPAPVQKAKGNVIKLVRKPKPAPIAAEKKKLEDMWPMSVVDQRQYLQDLRKDDPEPTDKAANEFIAAADAAAASPIPPSIWDAPPAQADNVANSRPGDHVEYRIAGKGVSLPHGYPDESVFILMASYRDPEAASTIARAYARAAHPDRVFVGIHAQNAGGDEEPERDPVGGLRAIGVECPEHPICSRIRQVRVSRAHWARSEGPTVARAIAERHYRNETYVLGIDSHCHFLRGWDNVGIDMFKRIGNDLAIISAYPPSYDENLQRGFGAESYDVTRAPQTQIAICRTWRVNCFTTVSFKHDMNKSPRPLHGPVRMAFFAAGFSFSRGHRIQRVPYDFHAPYLFDGEEMSMGVRAWTWGYDLYQPDADIISHLYTTSKSKLRPMFWNAPDWEIQRPLQFGSILRMQKQLKIYPQLQGQAGPPKLQQLDMTDMQKYEAGPRRSPHEFFRWAKVDLRNNWGGNCNNVHNPNEKSEFYCSSEDVCGAFKQEGGMPYVPWAEGTEDLFPPMVRTSKYPPKH